VAREKSGKWAFFGILRAGLSAFFRFPRLRGGVQLPQSKPQVQGRCPGIWDGLHGDLCGWSGKVKSAMATQNAHTQKGVDDVLRRRGLVKINDTGLETRELLEFGASAIISSLDRMTAFVFAPATPSVLATHLGPRGGKVPPGIGSAKAGFQDDNKISALD
jgi:hypothetical protein